MKYQFEDNPQDDPNRNAGWDTSMWGNNFHNFGTGVDVSNPIKFKDAADGIFTAIKDWESYRATNYQNPSAQPQRNTFGSAGGAGQGPGAGAASGGSGGGAGAGAAGTVAEPTAAGSAAEIVANAPSQATALASAKATAGGGIKSFLLKEGGKQVLGKLTGGGGGGGGGFYMPQEQYGFEKKDTYNKFGGSPLTTLYQKYK